MKLTQHPLSAAFPAMLAEEFQGLRDSVNNCGVLNPITLLDGMVLDGWHRYTAAQSLGMACPTVELDDTDPQDFVMAQNKARRHITAAQLAMITTAVYAWRPPHRPNKSAVTADLSKTVRELADIAGVGTRTIEQAKAVHAGAVPAVQDAVKAGAVSVETAAAVAKLPAAEQQAIAAAGPDAMRAVAKRRSPICSRPTPKIGTCANPEIPEIGTSAKNAPAEIGTSASLQGAVPVPAAGTSAKKQAKEQAAAQAHQVAEDAHGDVDLIAMLEASETENAELRALLAAAHADDQKAETLKWRRIADVAQRRQDELMDTVNAREKELQRQANWLRRIGAALNEDDHSRLPSMVEAMAQTAKTQVHVLEGPALPPLRVTACAVMSVRPCGGGIQNECHH